jgi:23S rRNA (uracil1939-C5)-methyltransferase
MRNLECRYHGRCSGCNWIDFEIKTQKDQKLTLLEGHFPSHEIKWVDCGFEHLRDRVDLTWTEGKLGLFSLGENREIVDLEICPMMSTPLSNWYQVYRTRKPAIHRGSVRLRVAPDGTRGVWLDFANVDVKALFDERDYLTWLSSQAIVEIGQRKKRLEWVDGQPKLKDPILFPWFETYTVGDKVIPLYGVVAGFSQTGFGANRMLVEEVCAQANATGSKEWLELFAGNGNFALAIAGSGKKVTAVEFDSIAVAGLKQSAELSQIAVEVLQRDLYRKIELPSASGWLVDPPRSGLKELLNLIEEHRPPALIYVSCWSESFLIDKETLEGLGYKLTSVAAVDQFIHSAHLEWVTTFKLG